MGFEVCEPHACTAIDAEALRAWDADGVLKISGIIPNETISNLHRRVVETMGGSPEDPDVWPRLRPAPLKPIMRDARFMPLEAEAVKEAVNAILGSGWEYTKSGGTWFANAPRQTQSLHKPPFDRVPRGQWHWDGRPDLDAVHGLWLFTPVTELLPHSGGTWIVAGSGRIVLDFYRTLAPENSGKPTKIVKQWFGEAHDWLSALNGTKALKPAEPGGPRIRLLNVAGRPGDVVLMKNFSVHSAPEVIGPGPRICHVVIAAHPNGMGTHR